MKKKITISKLKKKVWKIFSKWIRERDKYTCYTCGKKGAGSFMHSGHFITRNRASTMFDEMNVHAQCMNCNIWQGGESGIYAKKLIKQYGKKKFDALVKKSQELHRFTHKELTDIGNRYKIK